jgi:IclR family acetate operon transcriptional repressor
MEISLKEKSMQASRKAKTVLKALGILEEVSRFDEGVSNAALADRLNLHASTCHRLLNTLVSEGYLSKAHGLYRMGYKVLQLQCLTDRNTNLRRRARPLLVDLRDKTGFTTNLAIRDGLKAVLIDIVRGSKNLVVNNDLGKSAPLHASSVGKCLFAFLPEGEREMLVEQLQLETYTNRTVTSIDELRRELEMTRMQGYAIDDEELVTGIRCIGAPVFGKGERVVAAISISGLAAQFLEEKIEILVSEVITGSKKISSTIVE